MRVEQIPAEVSESEEEIQQEQTSPYGSAVAVLVAEGKCICKIEIN